MLQSEADQIKAVMNTQATAFNAAVDALVSGATGPTGPTGPPGTSPDGTYCPPASQLTDPNGGVWTLSGGSVLLNGASYFTGAGQAIAIQAGVIYSRGSDGSAWKAVATGWVPASQMPTKTN